MAKSARTNLSDGGSVWTAISTYPATLFQGTVKLTLYTQVLASFISGLSIEALRSLSWTHALLAVAGSTTPEDTE